MSDAVEAEVPGETPPQPLAYAFARERGVVLLQTDESGRAVLGLRGGVAEVDPLAVVEARRVAGRPVRLEAMPEDAFERRLSEIYSSQGIQSHGLEEDEGGDDLTALAEGLPPTADLLDAQDDAPVIRLINALIAEAVRVRASDIHVEPYEKELSVRLRIDGVLREVLTLPARVAPTFVSRVKVMARLDIAEKRVPQDGRISLSLGGKSVDVRVSTLPSRFGERVVMRLLDKDQARLDLDALGMPKATLERFKAALKKPNGVILVTGPTGSGKTTTLYGGITLLNDRSRNILTVEDPVEYAVEGVGQTQVNSKVGMTFAAGLRAILRQDPDIVMVGEIRDVETAQIAVRASLTGHLVLSTVHTNSALGAVTRLRDMGVEPFLLSSTLTAVMAQRLVRRLCPACKAPTDADAATRRLMGMENDAPFKVYRPVGCPRCNHTGYEGRVGLYELVTVDETLRRMIHDDAGEQDLALHAFRETETLASCGFAKVRAGETSLEEVLRVVKQDEDGAETAPAAVPAPETDDGGL